MEYPEILLIIDKEQVKEIYYFIKKKKNIRNKSPLFKRIDLRTFRI